MSQPINPPTNPLHNFGALIFAIVCIVFVYFFIETNFKERRQSQILCLKHHSASNCGLERPPTEVWNYCIQHNNPKDCGRKPY